MSSNTSVKVFSQAFVNELLCDNIIGQLNWISNNWNPHCCHIKRIVADKQVEAGAGCNSSFCSYTDNVLQMFAVLLFCIESLRINETLPFLLVQLMVDSYRVVYCTTVVLYKIFSHHSQSGTTDSHLRPHSAYLPSIKSYSEKNYNDLGSAHHLSQLLPFGRLYKSHPTKTNSFIWFFSPHCDMNPLAWLLALRDLHYGIFNCCAACVSDMSFHICKWIVSMCLYLCNSIDETVLFQQYW